MGDASYPYALHWRLEGGKPVVGEVMPGPHPAVLGPSSPDPAEAETGLPFAVRCLATWWRVERHCPPHPPEAAAAAIAAALTTAAGLRRPPAHTSSIYATAPEGLESATPDLREHLSLDRNRGW